MWQNAHDAYLESRICSADPLELVRLLYNAGTQSVRDARRHLAAGDIAARCKSISRAYEILVELAASLNHELGGDLSARLAQLYDYMQRRLLESNLQQTDAPLAEVLGLLTTLGEGWEGISHSPEPEEPPAGPWTQAPPSEVVSHGWSL
jgi:flagellar secretion chaperone FliS